MWKLTAVLLGGFLLATFAAGIFLADTLNRYDLGGVPLGYWMSHHGLLYLAVLICWVHLLITHLDAVRGESHGDDGGDGT